MYCKLLLLASFIAICIGGSFDEDPLVRRLPRTARPWQYTLVIYTGTSGRSFTGNVTINVEILQDTDSITLNAYKQLKVTKAILYEKEKEISSSFTRHKTFDFLTIKSSKLLHKKQRLTLFISFSGFLSTSDIVGYFRVEDSTSQQWISGTVFQTIEAREAFPCWDEPEFKAQFLVSLIHPTTHKALSNMPLESSESCDEEDCVIDHFANSPPMSSYLVTFSLIQWPSVDGKTDDGRVIKLWVPPRDVQNASKSLEMALRSISWLEDYTGKKDPLPKIDMVAVPGFPGALENWGDIVYDSSVLSGNPNQFDTIAHELAHSWFGNLVTPLWWDSLWLSEGAATFFSNLAMEHIKPEMALFERETITMVSFTFIRVSSGKTKSLAIPTKHKKELIDFPFSVYFYGFSIFRMLYYTLGPKQLQAGIQSYVHDHQYGSVTPEDLFKAMNYKWKNITLEELMKGWTIKSHLPVVNATRAKGQIILSQRSFSFSGSKEDPDDSKWWVPITFTSQSSSNFDNTQPKLWFRESTTLNDPADPSEWLLFNLQAAGLYLVSYDSANLNLIMKALASDNHGGIPPIQRAKLWLDLAMLCIGNFYRTSCDDVFYLIELLKDEHDYAPWVMAKTVITYMVPHYKDIENPTFKKHFMEHLRNFFKGVSAKLKNIGLRHSDGETVLTTELRLQLLMFACDFGLPECRKPNGQMHSQTWLKHHHSDFSNRHIKRMRQRSMKMT